MPRQQRVLEHFQARLAGAVSRSSFLKIRISKTGRLLDCRDLNWLQPGLDRKLITAVLQGQEIVLDLGKEMTAPPAGGADQKRTQFRRYLMPTWPS